jgi:FtsP/CotA-like multicopper oxidase with cupredoxin domain
MPKQKKKITSFRNIIFVLLILFLGLFIILTKTPDWEEPTIIKSKDGVLNLTLEAKEGKVVIGGVEQDSNVWNGKYISDTWKVNPGDKIKIKFVNNMKDPTNLHFHGGHVSPKGNSDNVLLKINPGETFDYEYNLPKNHPAGLFWYHPHLHGYTDMQVTGGMLGAIEVKGDIDELSGIKGLPEKLLVLTTKDSGNTVERFVNGKKDPTLHVKPFETVRLRILNASGDDFYNFSIPGQKLNIISRDGNTLSEVESVDSEVMAPGDRIEILYKALLWGTFDVKSLKLNAGFMYPEDTFMKIKVFGIPVIPKELPKTLIPYDNFKNVKIDRVRTLTFTEAGTKENPEYLLDGKQFDPKVIDQVMTLGATEEWRLINKSRDTHPFHIHINPYQVISVNGKDIDRKGLDDTFPVPANGEVVIRTKYRDFDGKYVLHCHILFHEDHGMMQVVEVVKPGEAVKPDNGMPHLERMLNLDHSTHTH